MDWPTVIILASGKVRPSEVFFEFGEACHFQELSFSWPEVLVLQRPGALVRYKDRIEAGFQGGIDIGFWAVADHPRLAAIHPALLGQPGVRLGILLFYDGGVAEIYAQARAVDLEFLLFRMTFGKEREIVAEGQ